MGADLMKLTPSEIAKVPFAIRDHATADCRREAIFSACNRHRYSLLVEWDTGKDLINFLMLNPSTATETVDDRTVAKCQTYARKWGFGRLVVTNLFSARQTDPSEMKRMADPGDDLLNDTAIQSAAFASRMVVCAWGRHGSHRNRSANVSRLLATREHKLHALRVTVGEPHHPLYLPHSLEPFPWRPKGEMAQ